MLKYAKEFLTGCGIVLHERQTKNNVQNAPILSANGREVIARAVVKKIPNCVHVSTGEVKWRFSLEIRAKLLKILQCFFLPNIKYSAKVWNFCGKWLIYQSMMCFLYKILYLQSTATAALHFPQPRHRARRSCHWWDFDSKTARKTYDLPKACFLRILQS